MVRIVQDIILQERQPLVSVGVITYNQKKYIGRCIDSILEQVVDFDYEIVIGDDGSTDGTAEICLDYQRRFPKTIKLILSKENRGLVQNYLSVAQHIRGVYGAQVAGDDYWISSDKLQQQISFLRENSDYDMVYTDFDFFLEDGTYIRNAFESGYNLRSVSFEDHLEHKRFMAPLTWVVRTNFNPVKHYEDKDYVDESFAHMLDLMQQAKIYYLPQSTAVKRVWKGSLSNPLSHEKVYAFHKGLFAIQKEFMDKYAVDEALKTRIHTDNYFLLGVAATVFKDQDFVDEAQVYFESKHLNPRHWLDQMNSLAVFYRKLYPWRSCIEVLIQVRSYILRLFK